MTLWTAAEAEAATGGTAQGDWTATGVSIDTRTLQPGDLFVALKAARDGHDFVAQALQAGAGAALVTHVPEGVAEDAPLLIVADVLQGLAALGRAARARTGAKVVAVTGSVGKTSTKEMLAQVLGDQGRTHASVASYNNHWGVPLTLARMPRDTEFAVIEIGMNHPGEIAPLARMARPHVAIVTTVAPAHLEAFDDIDGIAREKASIVEGLEPGGTAVLNGDVATASILRQVAEDHGARVVSFGRSDGCHHQLQSVTVTDTATLAEARAWRTPILFKVGVPGSHFAMNAMAVLAAIWVLDCDRARAVLALGRWTAVTGRGAREHIVLDPVERDLALDLIDDSYNANPASMAAALEVLAAANPNGNPGLPGRGRRVAVLGDMKELGGGTTALHADLAALPAMGKIDVVHCIGPLMLALYDALPEHRRGLWMATSAEMAGKMNGRLHSGDVVLVKGSLSMKLALIVDAIRKMGHGGVVSGPQDDD